MKSRHIKQKHTHIPTHPVTRITEESGKLRNKEMELRSKRVGGAF